MNKLRLLLPLRVSFGGKKVCVPVSIKPHQTIISKESLINVVYDNGTVKARFSYRKCQVRCEMTEGSSVEFIGYQMLPHE